MPDAAIVLLELPDCIDSASLVDSLSQWSITFVCTPGGLLDRVLLMCCSALLRFLHFSIGWNFCPTKNQGILFGWSGRMARITGEQGEQHREYPKPHGIAPGALMIETEITFLTVFMFPLAWLTCASSSPVSKWTTVSFCRLS